MNTLKSYIYSAVGALFRLRWNEVVLVELELMLEKCQINTNINKNGFVFPTKSVERVLN